jgi:hypothetical protein
MAEVTLADVIRARDEPMAQRVMAKQRQLAAAMEEVARVAVMAADQVQQLAHRLHGRRPLVVTMDDGVTRQVWR